MAHASRAPSTPMAWLMRPETSEERGVVLDACTRIFFHPGTRLREKPPPTPVCNPAEVCMSSSVHNRAAACGKGTVWTASRSLRRASLLWKAVKSVFLSRGHIALLRRAGRQRQVKPSGWHALGERNAVPCNLSLRPIPAVIKQNWDMWPENCFLVGNRGGNAGSPSFQEGVS